jgi:small subunit ribosomal protein S21
MAMAAPDRIAQTRKMGALKAFGEPRAACYSALPSGGAPPGSDLCRPDGRGGPAEGEGGQVQVLVRDNNVDQALKALKKKMQREGIFREMKLRRHYEKPSERRAREAAEAVRRARKMERKRLEREGF